MTVLSDFVVANNDPFEATKGKWTSDPFETGGALSQKKNGVEQDNAYITVTLTSTTDVRVRVIINKHPLPEFVIVKNRQRTAALAFPGSFLDAADGEHNVIELHSDNELPFRVVHVICHFRQNS